MVNGIETLHTLFIEDSQDDVDLLVMEISTIYKLIWERVETEAGLIIAMNTDWDIVICDYKLPGFSIERALSIVREKSVDTPFIAISGYVKEGEIIELLKKGVHDFVSKGENERLLFVIKRELREHKQRRDDQMRSEITIRRANEQIIEAWGKALELRDKYSRGHTQRVTDLSLRLAVHMGVPHAEVVDLNRGALLHDIGKIRIPDEILFKPDTLSIEEMAIMRRHPRDAYDMLKGIEFLKGAIVIPYCHHERWNGTGYPQGLAGESIPFLARLFSVADVYDALTTDRPYRPSWEKAKAIAYLLEEREITFDPNIIDAFVEMIGRG